MQKKLLLTVASLVLGLAFCEVLVRALYGPVARANLTRVPFSIGMNAEIPDVPYQLRPSSEALHSYPSNPRGYFDVSDLSDAASPTGATSLGDANASETHAPEGGPFSIPYRINSLGFRGPEVALRKPRESLRIVLVGDSFTFGQGVRFRDTYGAILAAQLNDPAAELSQRRTEVLNLGVMGYNTVNAVSLLKHVGVRYQPDIVVLQYFLDDTGGGDMASFLNAGLKPRPLPWWRRSSALADRVVTTVQAQFAQYSFVDSYRNSIRDDSEGWRKARSALRQAKALADERNFELVLMIYPMLFELSGDYPFVQMHQALTRFAEGLGLRVLDLFPDFAAFEGPELWVHPLDQHPNEQAQQIAGRSLARFLIDEGVLARAKR